ncbi:hypothetical protein JOE29_000235 [Pseudomonas sp. PvP009]|jgi:hypothetical protein|nr:hypothetical protein [Pseudomonas sp. PvP009]
MHRACMFFNQVSVELHFIGLQTSTNTLSTEAPTDFGYNFIQIPNPLWTISEMAKKTSLSRRFHEQHTTLIIF